MRKVDDNYDVKLIRHAFKVLGCTHRHSSRDASRLLSKFEDEMVSKEGFIGVRDKLKEHVVMHPS